MFAWLKYRKSFCFFLVTFISFSVCARAELKIGDAAPDFYSEDELGNPVSLSDFRGKTLVLYFYPKDGTPACTKEAQSFRDHISAFGKKNVAVVGVSFDKATKHVAFKKEHGLPFPLLATNQKKIAELYGVGGYVFADRDTIIIGPDGKISGIFRSVKAEDHALFILEQIK